jgi:ubiquinone/menaquinone biosynthesis C-methylase UbiE
MEEPTQKEVWNKIAQDWRKFRDNPREEVMDFILSCKGKLLDLGCGSGRHFIKKENLKIYGIDFSNSMMELAKKNVKKENIDVELKIMQDEIIPYEKEFFDNIICVAVLHCVETREKRRKLLREIQRVLKKKGRVLIQVWSKNHKRIKNKGKEIFVPWTIDKRKFNRYYYVYDLEELKKEIEDSGLKIISNFEEENITFICEKI